MTTYTLYGVTVNTFGNYNSLFISQVTIYYNVTVIIYGIFEIDFVICYQGCSYLVEAKAKTGNTKSSKTVMAHPDHYGVTKLLRIGDYKLGEVNDILTIPHYMSFLIGKG